MEGGGNDEKTTVEEPLLQSVQEKGGFRTLPYIIGNEAFEKMATFGLLPNLTLYLMNEYHMEMMTGANVLFMWSAATNFMPLIGAFIADSYLGRYHTIGFGSIICLMGVIQLWSTTIIPHVRPPPCDQSSNVCSPPTTFQFLYLCMSLGLISIGAGAIRSSSLAFGADQLEKRGFHKNPGMKQTYFGWSSSSLITGFVQVAVASYRNRHLKFSEATCYQYHCKNGLGLVFPSQNLRFLNKACIVSDAQKELTPDGRAMHPWKLCTVEQVEELKALLRVVPIWSSGTIMLINLCQSTFPVLQAASMDRHITSSFEIPSASVGMFLVVAVIVWVAIYDRVFLPLASCVMGRPVHVSTKQRMGIGVFLSFLAMIVSSMVEGIGVFLSFLAMIVSSMVEAIRRSLAVNQEVLNKPHAVGTMSSLWLIPQNVLSGFAEAANGIAQNEFYFSEFPRSMSSIASTLSGIGMCLANLLASFMMNIIDYLSKEGGNESWISSNINKGHYDYYYLVLAGLSMANMLYFLVCSFAFGPLKEDGKVPEEEEEL